MSEHFDDELLENLDRPAGERASEPTPASAPSDEAAPEPDEEQVAHVQAEFMQTSPDLGPLKLAPKPDDDDDLLDAEEGATVRALPPPEERAKAAEPKRKLTLSLGAERAPPPETGAPLLQLVEDDADPVEAAKAHADRRIASLQGQLQNVRAQLEVEKKGGGRTQKPWPLLAGALAAGLVLGGAAGFMAGQVPEPVPYVTVVGQVANDVDGPRYKHKSTGTHPSEKDVEDARNMLKSADELLAKGNFPKAQEFLRLCIEIGDLPECHKRVGSILALTRQPGARAHFRAYANGAPDAEDVAWIRRTLQLDNKE